jgi:hypothetical protein
MIIDRTEQFERPATRPGFSAKLHILRRRHGAVAPAYVRRPAQDMRAGVAAAFRAAANGVAPAIAQTQAGAFYRSGGQSWARALGATTERVASERVAAAFRAMAHGIDPRAACAATVRFFRSSGHGWTRGLDATA